MVDYKTKYLKYKTKYLEEKKLLGGRKQIINIMSKNINPEIIDDKEIIDINNKLNKKKLICYKVNKNMILCSKHPNKYDKFNIKTDNDNIDVYLKPDNALLWDPRKDIDIKDAFGPDTVSIKCNKTNDNKYLICKKEEQSNPLSETKKHSLFPSENVKQLLMIMEIVSNMVVKFGMMDVIIVILQKLD